MDFAVVDDVDAGGEACGGVGGVYGFADEDAGNGVDVDGAVGAVDSHIFNTLLRAFVVKTEVVEAAPVAVDSACLAQTDAECAGLGKLDVERGVVILAVDVKGRVRLAHIVGHCRERGVVERHEWVFGRIHVVACQQLLGAVVVSGTRFGLIAIAVEALHLEAVFAGGMSARS